MVSSVAGGDPMTSDETLLLQFARSRDPDALETLIGRRYQRALSFAARSLGDAALAEDATQEAFLALARSAHRFQAGRPFQGWWTTILLNSIRSAFRERRRRAAAAVPDTVPAPGADVDRSLLRGELEAGLARIPDDLREAVSLHYLEGRTHAEIAARMGCTVATASSRIRRGVRDLRRTLRRDGGACPVELPAALAWTAYVLAAVGLAVLLLGA